jgi:hypothetical protein
MLLLSPLPGDYLFYRNYFLRIFCLMRLPLIAGFQALAVLKAAADDAVKNMRLYGFGKEIAALANIS